MSDTTDVQHFNYGYLRKYAEAGVNPENMTKVAWAPVEKLLSGLSTAAQIGLLTVPAGLGVITGAIHHTLTSPDQTDLDAARKQIIIDAYNREADSVKRRTRQKAGLSGAPASAVPPELQQA